MTRKLTLSIWMVLLSRLCQCSLQVPASMTQMYRKDLLLSSPISPVGQHHGIEKHDSNSHDVSVCRGHMRSITCPNLELLHIFNAFYGKLSGHDCETPIAQFRSQMPTCFAKDAPNIIRQTCQGQQSCDLYAEDSLYNNPCPSVKKYLYVSFTCQGKSRLPEILKMYHEKQRAQRRYQIHQQEIQKFTQKQNEDAQKNFQQRSQLFLQQQQQQQRQQYDYNQRQQQLEQRQLATQQLAVRKQQFAQQQMAQREYAQRQQTAAKKAQEQQTMARAQEQVAVRKQQFAQQQMAQREYAQRQQTAAKKAQEQQTMAQAQEQDMKRRLLLQQRQQAAQNQRYQQQRLQQHYQQQMQQQMQRQQIMAQQANMTTPYAAMAQQYASAMLRASVAHPPNSFPFYPYRQMLPPPAPATAAASALPGLPPQAAPPLSSLTPQAAAAAGGYLRQFISQSQQYLGRPKPPSSSSVFTAARAAPPPPQYFMQPQAAPQPRFLPQPKPNPPSYLPPLPPPPQMTRTAVSYTPQSLPKTAQPQAKMNVPVTSNKYSPFSNIPQQTPVVPKSPQLPISRGSLPPPGWVAKPDIKFYQKQVSTALNSLYRLYTNNKCDKCDGNCNNYHCWGCGGCALPSLEKHQNIAPWHPPTNDAAKRMFNRVKEAMFRQHVNYYPSLSAPTQRSNVTQPLDARKQYWNNLNNHREMLWPFFGKAFSGPFSPSLFKKQAQFYTPGARQPQFHRRAWSYQGKEWPHERNIPITRNMWLAVRDNVASNANGLPVDDRESVVRTADGLTFQYHDAFANNAMALSGLVLYPFPKRRKKKSIPIPPKRRTPESSDGFDVRRSKVKLPDRIRQILGMKRSKLPKETKPKKKSKKKKKGRRRRSLEEQEDGLWYKKEDWLPELTQNLYEIT